MSIRSKSGPGRGFTVVTWQFPVPAEYRGAKLPWIGSKWRPVVEAGPSFRPAGNLNGYNPSHYGATAGGGVETMVRGFVRLTPALRYTRWAGDTQPYPTRSNVSTTNRNSVELVFGASF